MHRTPWEDAGMNYSILCVHTRFNGDQMEKVMGKDAVFLTMLRDPVDVFESQYDYYGLYKKYGMSIGEMGKNRVKICCN